VQTVGLNMRTSGSLMLITSDLSTENEHHPLSTITAIRRIYRFSAPTVIVLKLWVIWHGANTMPKEPRVLLWDIENSPNLAWVWGKYDQDVVKFEQEWHLLSVAWKWRGEKKTHVLGLDDFPSAYRKDPTDDYYLAWEAHQLLDEADVVIAHNGDRFDTRKTQARLLIHGFDPPSPFRSVDTLKVAKQHFMFNSNKLGDLGETLGLGEKVDTGGFKLWLGCMRGDPKAWALMKKYNRQDVVLLEKVYERMLPWINNHPNMALIGDRPESCPKCFSEAGMIIRGYHKYHGVTKARVFQCRGCGGYSHHRLSEPSARPTYK
jgi:RNase_H superfamily